MKYIFAVFIFFITISAWAGEWVTLRSSDLLQYEVSKEGAVGVFNEGLYIKHKTSFVTSVDCPKKDFVLIKDSKLADRALSSLLYANATNKVMQFYVDGCNQGYLMASVFMVIM